MNKIEEKIKFLIPKNNDQFTLTLLLKAEKLIHYMKSNSENKTTVDAYNSVISDFQKINVLTDDLKYIYDYFKKYKNYFDNIDKYINTNEITYLDEAKKDRYEIISFIQNDDYSKHVKNINESIVKINEKLKKIDVNESLLNDIKKDISLLTDNIKIDFEEIKDIFTISNRDNIKSNEVVVDSLRDLSYIISDVERKIYDIESKIDDIDDYIYGSVNNQGSGSDGEHDSSAGANFNKSYVTSSLLHTIEKLLNELKLKITHDEDFMIGIYNYIKKKCNTYNVNITDGFLKDYLNKNKYAVIYYEDFKTINLYKNNIYDTTITGKRKDFKSVNFDENNIYDTTITGKYKDFKSVNFDENNIYNTIITGKYKHYKYLEELPNNIYELDIPTENNYSVNINEVNLSSYLKLKLIYYNKVYRERLHQLNKLREILYENKSSREDILKISEKRKKLNVYFNHKLTRLNYLKNIFKN